MPAYTGNLTPLVADAALVEYRLRGVPRGSRLHIPGPLHSGRSTAAGGFGPVTLEELADDDPGYFTLEAEGESWRFQTRTGDGIDINQLITLFYVRHPTGDTTVEYFPTPGPQGPSSGRAGLRAFPDTSERPVARAPRATPVSLDTTASMDTPHPSGWRTTGTQRLCPGCPSVPTEASSTPTPTHGHGPRLTGPSTPLPSAPAKPDTSSTTRSPATLPDAYTPTWHGPAESGDVGPVGPTGPMGVRGFAGLRGHQGSTGATGDQGVPGHTGSTGAQGQQGDQGDQGDEGQQGDQGPRGNTGPTGSGGGLTYDAIQALPRHQPGRLDQFPFARVNHDDVGAAELETLAGPIGEILDEQDRLLPEGALDHQTVVWDPVTNAWIGTHLYGPDRLPAARHRVPGPSALIVA